MQQAQSIRMLEEEEKKIQPCSLTNLVVDNFLLSSNPGINTFPLITKISEKFSLKIEQNPRNSTIFVTGTLIHPNGELVQIPELFRSLLVKYLERQNQTEAKYKFETSHQILILKNSFKFDPISGPTYDQIQRSADTIQSSFKSLLKALQFLGITSKFSTHKLKNKQSELILLKRCYKLLETKNCPPKSFPASSWLGKKGCVFKQCESIEEKDSCDEVSKKRRTSVKTGGYFQICRKTCKIEGDRNREGYNIELAVKQPRKDRSEERKKQTLEKVQKQFKILHEIIDDKYFLTYWKSKMSQSPETKIYMDYISETLNIYIHYGFNSLETFLDFSDQIIKAVQTLHHSGIVHRDLKPENILVSSKDGRRTVKIIDFGESALISDEFKKSKQCYLGSTIPYSPVQCTIPSAQSYNSVKIDLWSVGVILFEMFFRKIPLSYSKCFSMEILKGWSLADEFSIFPTVHKKKGIQIISYIVSLMSMCSICVEQNNRLELQKMRNLLQLIKNFLVFNFTSRF